jgi:type IV pilus assembly protein PilB
MALLKLESPTMLYRSRGCAECGNRGYRGRRAVHEVMYVEREHRAAIEGGCNADELRRISLNSGMVSLFYNCKNLVLKGETTVQEMVRTVYARD